MQLYLGDNQLKIKHFSPGISIRIPLRTRFSPAQKMPLPGFFYPNRGNKRTGGIASTTAGSAHSILRFFQTHEHKAVIGEAIEEDLILLMENRLA